MSTTHNTLWRVTFCSIAISCTLSQNAHDQNTDRIKDLACVLFLSGLQKEDLDVGMLIKLQRHNINIDSINNEELRKACGAELSNATSNVRSNEAKFRRITTSTEVDKSDVKYIVQTEKTLGHIEGPPNIESVMNFWRNIGKRSETKEIEAHNINTRRAQGAYLIKNQHQTMELNKQLNPLKYNFNVERIDIDHKTEPIFFNVQPPHFERNLALKSYEHINNEHKQDKIPTEQKIDDILKTINQFKLMFSKMNSDNNYNRAHDTAVVELAKVEMFNPPENNTKLEPTPPNFTDDLVKKIAQSVKDMVLQDLRKEMQFTTTTTTQKVETLSISQKDSLNNDENVINKVMAILQSMKQQPTQYNKDNEIKSNQVNNMNKNGQISKQINNVPHRTSYIAPQVIQLKTDNQKQNGRPITFQTNSLEIPPLGIPLTHGQNPINQNIVVTTPAPFKTRYESDKQSYSDSALMKVYPKVIESPLSARFSERSDDCPLNHPCNHKNDDVIRFRLDNNGKAHYDNNYYDRTNLGRIRGSSGSLAPRFHEKLESVAFGDNDGDCCRYPITQKMVECCNEKITSRQQTFAQKRGSYDETHFRNFLKTQQKVTDMLQQILASKTREMPLSVETA